MEKFDELKLELLKGSYEDAHALQKLFENKDIALKIFGDIEDEINTFQDTVVNSDDAYFNNFYDALNSMRDRNITFPTPQDLNINMMPIPMPSNYYADVWQLPPELEPYKSIILTCLRPQLFINSFLKDILPEKVIRVWCNTTPSWGAY